MTDLPRVPLPSFEEVRRELDRRVGEQERRAAAADTKAGLILGFDGILVGLSLDRDGWVFVGGQAAAAASALVALEPPPPPPPAVQVDEQIITPTLTAGAQKPTTFKR